MSRNEAIEILKRARDILVKRLAEEIVDNRDWFINHLSGEGWFGSEQIFETGDRLVKINQMLANLPPDVAEAPVTTQAYAMPIFPPETEQ